MDTLKVVPYSQGYLGVYHCTIGHTFVVRVATSTNLRVWHYWSQLDTHASQPTLAAVDGGGYLLAIEADNDGHPGPGRRWLRFRHYRGLQDLLSARADLSFDAPHTLTAARSGAEGTPNIYSASFREGVADSVIMVGFHYMHAGVDREARGVLTDFSSWMTAPDRRLDRALDDVGLRGKHGDRDAVRVPGNVFVLIEAQTGSLWRIALMDARTRTLHALNIITPARSASFANPTAVLTVLPNGEIGFVVTLFVPMTGAAGGEAGELLYYNEL